jgi:drug/metabolite transporter (DMT)-like permease
LALSAVLYLAGGAACLVFLVLVPAEARRHGGVHGREWLWLAGAVAAGAVAAPVALFAGLQRTSGHAAGLLLNAEVLFTVGISILVSGERLGRRGWLGAAGIWAGAVLLSMPSGPSPGAARESLAGGALVVAACALWGLDNNLTQRLSLCDARRIVAVKGLAGGLTNLVLATVLGAWSGWTAARFAGAIALGAIAIGLSIVLFVRGLRHLGVAQTALLFSLAPGFAALLSWIALREPVDLAGALALAAMCGGALLLTGDRHAHTHEHEAVEHAHPHEHDEHHDHGRSPEETDVLPHVHRHRHPRLAHDHPHLHDAHHRHGH